MASKNKDERAHVNALVAVLTAQEPKLYVVIDRDAGGMRHTSSGWDFALVRYGEVIFCEAKEGTGKLSSWQELTQARVLQTGTPYRVVRFWDDGQFFTVDDGKKIAISAARFIDFLEG